MRGGLAVVWMTFSGSAILLDGWRFLGRYDYANDDLHLIMSPPGTEIPEGMTIGPATAYCDHCGKYRQRNSTFLLQHTESGNLKIVGSSCLKDFLGPDGLRFAEMFSMLLADPIEALFDHTADDWGAWLGPRTHFDRRETLAWTSSVTRKLGWVSRNNCQDFQTPTAEIILMIFTGGNDRESKILRKECAPEDQDYSVADRTIEIIRESRANNDYMIKLRAIAGADEDFIPIKHESLWVSAITVYMREIEDSHARRIDAEIQEGRQVLKGTIKSIKEVMTGFGCQLKMLLIDSQGLKYWGSVPRGREPAIGERVTIKATIKRTDDPKFGIFSRPIWY